MDAVLLLVEALGIFLVIRWVARGDGTAGLLGWKGAPVSTPPGNVSAAPDRTRRGVGRR